MHINIKLIDTMDIYYPKPMDVNIQKPSTMCTNLDAGSLEHPKSVIVGNNIEFKG